MKKLNISIRFEILFNLLILMGVAILTVGVMAIKIFENNMVAMKINSGKRAASHFASSVGKVSLNIGRLEDKALKPLIDDFVLHGLAKEVVVTGADYLVVSSSDPALLGKLMKEENFANALTFKSLTMDFQAGESVPMFKRYKNIAFFQPVLTEGEVSAVIKLVLPVDELNHFLFRTGLLVLFFLIFDSVLLIIFGNFLLGRTVVRPLGRFIRVAEKVAGGDLSQRVDYEVKNEIGQLASSFNRMTERLESEVRGLEEVNYELKSAQADLVRSEKLASVGRLAAGVAHEVGNPLGAILGYTQMLIKGATDADEQKDCLARIEKDVRKIDGTLRDLLDYSRTSEVDLGPLDLNSVLRESASLVSHQKGFESVDIEWRLNELLPPVRADAKRLEQIFVNMLLNAVDAMPEGGHLLLATEQLDSGGVEWARLVISDTGSGIASKDIDKLFDPFYTTKEPGKGTGLGLYISQNIIESFGGKVEVESEPGRGASFTVLLPLYKEGSA